MTDNTSTNHAYILLDRTGSMSQLWDEALTSVNTYVRDLSTKAGAPAITLAVFDAQDGLQFDVLRRSTAPADWKDVTSAEASPRGMTPLFDSIARIIAIAEADAPDKAVLVIMTDGEENASREVTKDGAKAALDRFEKRGWETVFLGADFAKFDDAASIGMAAGRTMAMAPGRMQASMQRLAKKSNAYYTASGTMDFDEADRAAAGEENVRKS